jgi:hypothetical protein
MPEKTPLRQEGYNGYIPTSAFTALSWELAGLVHGTATLTIHIRDGRLARYTTGRERSFVEGCDAKTK